MIKLWNANFTRLRKNKIFWLLTIFSIGLALLMIYTKYNDMKKYGDTIDVSQLILNYTTIIGIIISIFTSLFLGVEYSDGAIRNKISIGHKRTHIYLSNLAITSITSVFFYIVFITTIIIIGIPLFGNMTLTISQLWILLSCIFITILAYSSIFTFIAMIISNKTIMAVTSLLLAFIMIIAALICFRVLDTQEYIQSAIMIEGQMKFEEIKNPKYPSEAKKKIYQNLLDINPTGQMFQISGKNASNLKKFPIYSLGMIIVFTSLGLVQFKKKELK